MEREGAEDDIELLVRQRHRARIMPGEGDSRNVGELFARHREDVVGIVAGEDGQRDVAPRRPAGYRQWDVPGAGGEIEHCGRSVAWNIGEKAWQVAKNGRRAAKQMVDPPDVAQIVGQLCRVVGSAIEQLFLVAPWQRWEKLSCCALNCPVCLGHPHCSCPWAKYTVCVAIAA